MEITKRNDFEITGLGHKERISKSQDLATWPAIKKEESQSPAGESPIQIRIIGDLSS
jgi:hypothetical protein